MAALDFPANPTEGQTFSPVSGLDFIFTGGVWKRIAPVGGVTIADTPPGPPQQAGQLWWQSSSGGLFIWYTDTNSSQWVQVA